MIVNRLKQEPKQEPPKPEVAMNVNPNSHSGAPKQQAEPVVSSVKPEVKKELPKPAQKVSPKVDRVLCHKESLSNEHIMALKKKEEKEVIECKTLENNELLPNETARFNLITEVVEDIAHFAFNVLSEEGFIYSAQIEKIVGNKVSLIINNLSDKLVKFGLQYMSLHK